MEKQDLPLFYRRPRPLQAAGDAELALAPANGYAFAAATNSVPVNAVEFTVAAKFYPIVFTEASPPLPVALLGLRQSENLFVDADGNWQPGTYVPAYVRRYPFIFMENPDAQQFVLCIDEAAETVRKGEGEYLFRNGEPSEITRNALAFCQEFQGHHLFTLEFAKAVEEAGLLTGNRADVTLSSGERLSLAGFRVIDEAKFNALPDETFLQWRAKGWLHLVYCHLISVGNWAALIDRAAQRQAA